MVVVFGSALTVMVPVAVTPGSGFSLKVSPSGLGDGLGEAWVAGDGDDVDPELEPQATPQTATAINPIHALADVNPARHRVLALPLQVT